MVDVGATVVDGEPDRGRVEVVPGAGVAGPGVVAPPPDGTTRLVGATPPVVALADTGGWSSSGTAASEPTWDGTVVDVGSDEIDDELTTTAGSPRSASGSVVVGATGTAVSMAARRPGLVHTECCVAVPAEANSASRTSQAAVPAATTATHQSTAAGTATRRRPSRRAGSARPDAADEGRTTACTTGSRCDASSP